MTIKISDASIEQSGFTPEAIKLEIALVLFQKDIFTLDQSARLAGIHRVAFQKELAKRKIPIHYDEEMLENDLKTLKNLFGDRNQ
ncbi:MAG: UPF0175 family protein [Bacteroidota bacterium]